MIPPPLWNFSENSSVLAAPPVPKDIWQVLCHLFFCCGRNQLGEKVRVRCEIWKSNRTFCPLLHSNFCLFFCVKNRPKKQNWLECETVCPLLSASGNWSSDNWGATTLERRAGHHWSVIVFVYFCICVFSLFLLHQSVYHHYWFVLFLYCNHICFIYICFSYFYSVFICRLYELF